MWCFIQPSAVNPIKTLSQLCHHNRLIVVFQGELKSSTVLYDGGGHQGGSSESSFLLLGNSQRADVGSALFNQTQMLKGSLLLRK